MANLDASFGLRLVGSISGNNANLKIKKFHIKSDYGTALYVGDPVELTGTSNTARITSGLEDHEIGDLADVQKATAGDNHPIAGVIVGFEPIVRSATAPYNPASTDRVCLVCIDPNALYLVQANGSVAVTDIGANANVVYDNSGSTYTGISGAELDTASMTTTNTYQLRILGNGGVQGRNTLGSANPVLLVKINNHHYGNAIAGV